MYNRHMDDNQFTKLFKYIVDMDKRIEGEFAEVRNDIRKLADTPDLFLKRLDTNETEQAARDLQWERLLDWAREVSKKTGVPLPDL